MTSHEMQVVLLGRDLLDKLGFNFEKHLAHNYSNVKDVDCSADNANKQPKCIMSYSGVTYN